MSSSSSSSSSSLYLSRGFLKQFFDGVDMVSMGVTPVLEVAEKFDEKYTLKLRDDACGKMIDSIIPSYHKEIAKSLEAFDRVLVLEYSMSKIGQGHKNVIMLRQFAKFDRPNLPINAYKYLTESHHTKYSEVGTSTNHIHTLLPVSPTKTHCGNKKLCQQTSWLLGRLGNSLRSFYSYRLNRTNMHGRCPINQSLSQMTGLSLYTIRRHSNMDIGDILPPCIPPRKKKLSRREIWEKTANQVEPFIRQKIRDSIHHHFKMQKPVKIEELIVEVKEDLTFDQIDFNPGKTKMRQILKGMGFRYERIKKNHQIYMRRDIEEWRTRYLRKIYEIRKSDALVIFQDETWIFSGMGHSRDWVDKTLEANPFESFRKYGTAGPIPPKTRGKRCIVIGAVSDEGLLLDAFALFDGGHTESGDYHKTMSGDIFKNWLLRSIPHFKSVASGRPIVLVMDNAPYHGSRRNQVPTKAHRKQELIDFLENNEKIVPGGLSKNELLALIDKLVQDRPGVFNILEADEICHQNGIEVVRLPPYHSELNVIELIWSDFKRKLRDCAKVDDRIDRLKEIGMQVLAQIPLQSIRNYCEHVKKIEQNFIRIENIQMERRIGQIIIPIEDDDYDEIENESEQETEVSDEEEEAETDEQEVDKENVNPFSDPLPDSPSPCPVKKTCQMPFY